MGKTTLYQMDERYTEWAKREGVKNNHSSPESVKQQLVKIQDEYEKAKEDGGNGRGMERSCYAHRI